MVVGKRQDRRACTRRKRSLPRRVHRLSQPRPLTSGPPIVSLCSGHGRPLWRPGRGCVAAQGDCCKDDSRSPFARLLLLDVQLNQAPSSYPTELLPKDITCSKETRDIVIECCVGDFASLPPCASHVDRAAEFIHLISSEANDICEKESKKTIAPDHILSALEASASHGSCPTP
jgi:hypothetical protein